MLLLLGGQLVQLLELHPPLLQPLLLQAEHSRVQVVSLQVEVELLVLLAQQVRGVQEQRVPPHPGRTESLPRWQVLHLQEVQLQEVLLLLLQVAAKLPLLVGLQAHAGQLVLLAVDLELPTRPAEWPKLRGCTLQGLAQQCLALLLRPGPGPPILRILVYPQPREGYSLMLPLLH